MNKNFTIFDDARSIVGLTGVLLRYQDRINHTDQIDYMFVQNDQQFHEHMMEIKSKLSARDQMRLFDYIYRRAK